MQLLHNGTMLYIDSPEKNLAGDTPSNNDAITNIHYA